MTNISAARQSAWRLWDVLRSGAAAAVVVVFCMSFMSSKEPPKLVATAGFENGEIVQRVWPEFGPPMQADWSASIFDAQDRFICGNGNNGTYERGAVGRFSLDEWTFDDCSDAVYGQKYQGRASWSWEHDGLEGTVSVNFEFVYSPPTEGEAK